MKKILLISFLLFTFLNANKVYVAVSKESSVQSEKFFYMITSLTQKIFNKKSKDIKIIFKYYKKNNTLLKDYKEGKIKIAVSSLRYFFKNEEAFRKNSKLNWVIGLNGQLKEQYYLIANKDFKKPFENLDKAEVEIADGFLNANHWFYSFIYKKYKTNFNNIIKKYTTKTKESKIIYDIFFNKNKVGIVNSKTYHTLLELNSQLKSKIIILKKSPKIFIPIIGFAHRSTNGIETNDIISLVSKIEDILENSPFVDNLKISTIVPVTKENITPLRDFYTEFERLNKRYSK